MNEAGNKTKIVELKPEPTDVIVAQRELAQKALSEAIRQAYLDDDEAKQEILNSSVLATRDDLREFAAGSELASNRESIGTQIWTILSINAKDQITNYPNNLIYDERGILLTEVKLTDRLMEVLVDFPGMGPTLKSILEDYYKTGLDRMSDASDVADEL